MKYVKIISIIFSLFVHTLLISFPRGAARVTMWNGRHGGSGSTGGFNLGLSGVTGGRVYSPQIKWGGYAHMSKSAYAPNVYNPQQSAWCTVEHTSRKI
jgi:hypothetical protein